MNSRPRYTMSRPDATPLTPAENAAGLGPIAALSVLDDTTRANIIGTIVGHPKGTPSKKELEYYNPSIAASTLTDHLIRLEEVGLIEVIERDREGLERGQPYRFFQLTDAARELFDRNNLFEPDAYRELFAEVEKTDEIEAAEGVERPNGQN
ncbi:ArsR family transcriptional regulator [Halorubrum ezzemoulense]|nr:ArsR family transcriptional regulator [Halorubrum ezzemoulense]